MCEPVKVGDRVRFSFEPLWAEEGVVLGVVGNLVEIELDETVELPDHLGGGWCRFVQRERNEIEVA